ncbi:hypothetical protein OC846_006283 [Tilletia horrida]|uniref:Uncharacterized protein n=1 Tax=Tilletia horrida TaxID=155126 RepID=A0AAN6GNY4_9BASI|nr:hypothetical protein OC845_006164 [Tilletia horrida]KAK0543799.1 hypothetical protein OC846_006283 [Tilletia horrida]
MNYTIDVDMVPKRDFTTDFENTALDPSIRAFMTGFEVLSKRAIKFAPPHDRRLFRIMQRVDDIRSEIAKKEIYKRRRSLETAVKDNLCESSIWSAKCVDESSIFYEVTE